ncbi:radical SAM family heme chaperone HemW [Magnetococcales bacterium HHB-1]
MNFPRDRTGHRKEQHVFPNVFNPPLTVYVHIPFCTWKCRYCNFFSQTNHKAFEKEYIDTLKEELHYHKYCLKENDDRRPLKSIYFGGGTPSLFSAEHLNEILETIIEIFPLEENCEITLEANPESLNLKKLNRLRKSGFNRISLGVQAWDDQRLHFLGRPHNVAQTKKALENIRQAGFKNLNMDLIFSTPNQDLNAWRRELEAVLHWQPEHLSAYALTWEEGTPLFQEKNLKTDEIEEHTFFHYTRNFLKSRGWPAYEVSNFARDNYFSRHNKNYWDYGDYLAVGAGAHGKYTPPGDRLPYRFHHKNNLSDYFKTVANYKKGASWPQKESILKEEAALEYLVQGLRQSEGISLKIYQSLLGAEIFAGRGKMFQQFKQEGWLSWNKTHLYLTEEGLIRMDSLIESLL